MTISNLTNSKGNKVANQIIVHEKDFTYFVSYGTNIVKIYEDNAQRIVLLDIKCWDYSKTTSKYRNLFLGETTKETQAKIDAGIYKLINLNNF